MGFPSGFSLRTSLKTEERKRFYEANKPIAVLMIAVVLLLPIAGAFARGLSGVALSLVISVSAYYLTPFAVLGLRRLFKDL